MSKKREDMAVIGVVLLFSMMVVPLVAEGGPAIVGALTGSVNVTIDGQRSLSNATIFSGDRLEVEDGGAIVALDRGSRVLLGRHTAASLIRETAGMKLNLDRGHLTVLQTREGMPMWVHAGDVDIVPAAGFKTLGEVALVAEGVAVMAVSGKLRLERAGTVRELNSGETVTLGSRRARAAGGQLPSGPPPAMNFTSRAVVWGLLLAGALGVVVVTLLASKTEQPVSPSSP